MTLQPFRTGIFVSYSHSDDVWLKRLRTFLAPHLRGEKLQLWDDSQIVPGADWSEEIGRALNHARVAVLLVSPDFLASDYVHEVELPAILERLGKDLTVFWIPVRPSAFDVTRLKAIQAAHNPQSPLSSLSDSDCDAALVKIARRIASVADINAAGNALRIIDDFEPEMSAFMAGKPEPDQAPAFSVKAEQVGRELHMVNRAGGRSVLVTAADFERLDANAQKLIRAYERTMKDLFERWTELKPKRVAQDSEVRREAIEVSETVRGELCTELTGLLGFFESMGMSLADHYSHVRYICKP
jgi:TIR domain